MKLRHTLKSSLAKVYSAVADVEKFGTLHPYIDRTLKTPEGYHVFETVPLLGLLTVKEDYIIQVDELVPMQKLRYRSQIKKNVFVEILFEFQEADATVIIAETINIEASFLERIAMGRMMKKAHRQLFQKLALA